MILNLVLLIVGFALLVKGADVFVDGAAGIAYKIGIPQLVVGLTIVAMGTSAPEAAVSITSALGGSAGITIGNVVGSNIMNILMVLGLTAAVSTLDVEKSTIMLEIPFLIIISGVLLLLGLDGTITMADGLVLLGYFLVYLAYLFYMAKRGEADGDGEEEESANRPVWQLIVFTIVGMAMVVFGSDVTVDAATEIAYALGMSERMVGLTIVAFGTSLPELVTCITAARKNEAGIAIGNIVGSCLFNILFVVSATAIVTDVPFITDFRMDLAVSIVAAVALLVSCLPHRHLSWHGSVLLLGLYVAYLIMLWR